MKVIFDRDESKNDAGENEFFVNLETILLADGLWDIPTELSAKLLCNDSRKIRARAISNPISDLNALEKFIEKETCRNNLNEIPKSDFGCLIYHPAAVRKTVFASSAPRASVGNQQKKI